MSRDMTHDVFGTYHDARRFTARRFFSARRLLALSAFAALVTAGAAGVHAGRAQAATHPRLVLTRSAITAIRARLATKAQPQTGAMSVFKIRLSNCLSDSPSVYHGPFRGTSLSTARADFAKLEKDGSKARDLGIGYVLTGSKRYATQARRFLLAWANGNTPTTIDDWNAKNAGQLQSTGDFSFAYAYDLTYGSGVYSSADRAVIRSWFHRCIAAVQSCLRPTLKDYYFSHPDRTDMKGTYEWDSSRHYSLYDAALVGSDFTALIQAASLAMAYDTGDKATIYKVMTSTSNPLGVRKILRSALTPHNDGDGAGTNPVPQKEVYKKYVSGRGGMFDYMTYNTRICSVLADMAAHLGWSDASVKAARAKLHTSWAYMAVYFPPSARRSFNPKDTINLTADLPRFTLAYHDFGDPRFLAVISSHDRSHYTEPQLLGPITLTHSIVGK